MAKSSSASRLATFVLIIPLLIGAYLIAPLFLPVWRWQNLDFAAIALRTGKPEAKLRQEFTATVRLKARADGDPASYQIIRMEPEWGSLDGNRDEEKLLVRCVFMSDRTGRPPSSLYIAGSSWKDTYFTCRVWRLPAKAVGVVPNRPVVIFQSASLDKLEIGAAQVLNDEVSNRGWDNDDNDVDDGFRRAP